MNIHATPTRQFPLRLDANLADHLEQVARQTHINKTTLTRIAITKFLSELDASGIPNALKQACEV